MKFPESIFQIKKYLTEQGFPGKTEAAVILGSGLGRFTDFIENTLAVPYRSIPHFPVTSVQGHDGALISGTVNGHSVLVFSGRFHHYEGYPFSVTALPVQLSGLFEPNKVIISNAAGALNTKLNVGDLMVIDDIFRPFQKISSQPSKAFNYNLYDTAERTRQIASSIGLDIQRGVYMYVNGPNYETKAEVTAFQRLGADVVGMSTVPELIEASRLNLSAVAISLITNMCTGISAAKLSHSEVKKAADSRKEDFARLVIELISQL